MGNDLLALLAAIALLAANAFFVGAEFSLISARRDRLEAMISKPLDLTPCTESPDDAQPWLQGAEGVIASDVIAALPRALRQARGE